MRLLKLLILIAVIAFGYHWWQGQRTQKAAVAATSPDTGFVSAFMPEAARANTVLILAPENCPSDGAQRAEALAAGLKRLGIPVERGTSFRVSISDPDAEQKARIDRSVAIINGAVPAVFFNGVGKANPSVDEVAIEYRRRR